jgi:hypothetical protein
MSFSLVNVQTLQNPKGVNVLAEDTQGNPAFQTALAAGAVLGTFTGATMIGQRPLDLVIAAVTAPATNDAPKAVYRVEFRPGSGPNGTTPAFLLVLSWPQTSSGVQTHPAVLAGLAAEAQASAVVLQISQLGQVEMDTTGNASTFAAPLTRLQFRSLFLFTELLAIDNVATGSLSSESKAIVTTVVATYNAAENIVLTDPATIAGVNDLVTVGILSTERAQQILAGQAPPTP